MDISGANSMNMRPMFGGYPFQGNSILCKRTLFRREYYFL